MDSQDQTFKNRDKFIHSVSDSTPFESKFGEGLIDAEELIAHLAELRDDGELSSDFPRGEEKSEAEPFIGPNLPPPTATEAPIHQGTFLNKIKVIVFLTRLLFIVKHDYSDRRFLALIARTLHEIVHRCNAISTTIFRSRYHLSPVAKQSQAHRLQILTYQVVRSIPAPAFKNNFEERARSGIPFQIQLDEDNPFLIFCRQYFDPTVDIGFHLFVGVAYTVFCQYYRAVTRDFGERWILSQYEDALTSRTIETTRDGNYYPDFPVGFDIDRYCGTDLHIFHADEFTPAIQARLPKSVNVGERRE